MIVIENLIRIDQTLTEKLFPDYESQPYQPRFLLNKELQKEEGILTAVENGRGVEGYIITEKGFMS